MTLFPSLFTVVSGQAITGQPITSVSGAITSPPSQCARRCSSFSLAPCAVTQVPSSIAQWTSTCNILSSCICPIMAKNEGCHSCLMINPDTVAASTYWGNLQTFCQQGTAAVQICQLFNVTISANIAGAENVTTTLPDLAPAPTATTKRGAGEKIAPSMRVTTALVIVLIASALM